MTKKTKSLVSLGQMQLLADAINSDNEDMVQLLVTRAMKIIYGDNTVNKKDVDAVIALIRGIRPKDAIELSLASQFVAMNLHGMATLSSNYLNSKGQAMMMIRLSHHALDMLLRYRGKGPINVLNEGNAVMNTMIQAEIK